MPPFPFNTDRGWFKQLFDLSPDPTWIIDNNRLVACNEAAIRDLGYTSHDELLNVHPSKLSPPRQPDGEDSYVKAKRMMALAKDKGSHRFEWMHTRSDGVNFAAEVTLSAIAIQGRQVVYCVWRDVTEQKRAEQALLRSKMNSIAIIDNLPFLAWTKDSDGRFMATNTLFARSCGSLSTDDLIGKTDLDIWPKQLAEAYRADDAEVMRSGQKKTVEERIVDQGQEKWFETYKAPLYDVDGTVSGTTGIARDITERKQAEAARALLEAQLRESQKMEALGTLAGGVAHDFNNILAMILGNVELARQDVGPAHPALESLEEIGKASRRAKDLVQQILAFGRRQRLERKPTSLSLVVLEAARMIRVALPSMVNLNVECRSDAPAVLADATALKQILLNLCSNALQAVQEQTRPGVIEIRLEAHTQGEAHGDLRPGLYACLTVRDNGPGMGEETRSRIFEPFFTTRQVGKGTGLGLSVVHGFVKAHDAMMKVESAPGEGSAFHIYFPAAEAVAADVEATAPDAAPALSKAKHVLYVDDEEAIIFLMKRLLERQGFLFSGYTDPKEALAVARANPDQFDLVVTDYNMPGISGLEVATALKEIRADLPVVLASGYLTEELRAEAPAAGVSELIYKPNTADDLCEAVARYANARGEKDKSS